MEVVKKRYADKTRFEAVASGLSCSAIFHVNEASRHVMIVMHQQYRNEAMA